MSESASDPAFYRWLLDLMRQFTDAPVWKIKVIPLTEQERKDTRALYDRGCPAPAAALFMQRVHRWQERA